MQHGTVKWFSDAKGFGFISSLGKDYFFHYKQIEMNGFKTLKSKDKVVFIPKNSEKGWIATRIILDLDPERI